MTVFRVQQSGGARPDEEAVPGADRAAGPAGEQAGEGPGGDGRAVREAAGRETQTG